MAPPTETAPLPQPFSSAFSSTDAPIARYALRHVDNAAKSPNGNCFSFFDEAEDNILPNSISFNAPWPNALNEMIRTANTYSSLDDYVNTLPAQTTQQKKDFFTNMVSSDHPEIISIRVWWINQVYKLVEKLHELDHNGIPFIDNVAFEIKRLHPEVAVQNKDPEELKNELIISYIKMFQHYVLLQQSHAVAMLSSNGTSQTTLSAEAILKKQFLNGLIDITSQTIDKTTNKQVVVQLFTAMETLYNQAQKETTQPLAISSFAQGKEIYNAYRSKEAPSILDACIARAKLTHLARDVTKKSSGWDTYINNFIEKLAAILTSAFLSLAVTPVTRATPTPPGFRHQHQPAIPVFG